MHKIEETKFGYRLTFEGFLRRDDGAAMLEEMKTVVKPRSGGFALLIDMRNSRAFPTEAQEMLRQALLVCKENGLARSGIVLNSAIATLQAKRLAKETGIEASIRYIDASTHPEWEKVAGDWLIRAVEPELG